jgi:hypothetical protein
MNISWLTVTHQVKSVFTHPFVSAIQPRLSTGDRRQIALTQVSPSTQAFIKTGCHTSHLRSSTITSNVYLQKSLAFFARKTGSHNNCHLMHSREVH